MTQMEFNPEFGRRLRELRMRKCRMGLREFARRVEVSPSYISQIEQGKMPPPITNVALIIKMAEVLRTDALELIRLAERPTHSIPELLRDHPEIPNLLAEVTGGLHEDSIRPAMIATVLQWLVADEYGKFVKRPTDEDVENLTKQVRRIRGYMKVRTGDW